MNSSHFTNNRQNTMKVQTFIKGWNMSTGPITRYGRTIIKISQGRTSLGTQLDQSFITLVGLFFPFISDLYLALGSHWIT